MRPTPISRRSFCHALGAGALGMAAPGMLRFTHAAPPPRPNILLISTDDQGVEVGCYGDPQARTPHLDALAATGMRCDRAYITQASCSPSRSSILTGLYPHQNGQIGLAHYGYRLHEGIATLPGELKRAGYRTGIIGKLHVNPESGFPFDFDRNTHDLSTRDVRWVAEEAARLFNEQSDAPFFLKIGLVDPHRPYANADQIKELPEEPRTATEVKPFPFLGVDSELLRKEVATYYNCVERLDAGIGMVMKALEESGKADSTLILFLGDHGAPFTRAKTTCYEAGVRVPFLLRWPGRIPPATVSDALVSSVDIMPTLLEAAGATVPEGLAGRSMLPLFRDATAPWRETLCTEYTTHVPAHYYPRRAIRDTRFKLIHNLLHTEQNPVSHIGPAMLKMTQPDSPQERAYQTMLRPPEFELYDLDADPYEWNDLSGDPDYEAILAALKEQLEKWQEETRDPVRDPDYLDALTQKHAQLKQPGAKWVP